MGFSSVRAYVDAIEAGAEWRQSLHKFTPPAALVASCWFDATMWTGSPRSNVYPGSMLTATQLNSKSQGAFWHGEAVTPATKHVTRAYLEVATASLGPLYMVLCDFLLFYPLIDCDYDAQQDFVNSVSLPRYTDGKGVRAMIVATSDLGLGSSTLYLDYRNSDGVDGQNMPIQVVTRASAALGSVIHSGLLRNQYGPFLPLQHGDVGVRRLNSIRLSAGTGGGWAAAVLVRPLLSTFIAAVGNGNERDYLLDLPSLPRVQDDAFLGWVVFPGQAATAGAVLRGMVEFAWGNG